MVTATCRTAKLTDHQWRVLLVVIDQSAPLGADPVRIEAAFGSNTEGFFSDTQAPGGWLRIRYPFRDQIIRASVARSLARLVRRGLIRRSAYGYYQVNDTCLARLLRAALESPCPAAARVLESLRRHRSRIAP